MLRYAVRGLPWGPLAAAGALIPLLLGIVRYNPSVMWPMQGTAVGLVAVSVAWCLDERAAAVADPTPRGVTGEILARSTGFLPITAVWAASVWWARDALFGHAWNVFGQGVAAGLLAAGWAASRRVAGEAEPGHRFALTVVPITTGWALIRPFDSVLPVFPYGDDAWARSTLGWSVVGTIGFASFGLVVAEARWWLLRTDTPRIEETTDLIPTPVEERQ
jgi:hypothetical protein